MRPLTPADMRAVAELHLASFGGRRRVEELEPFLDNIFFRHPWPDDSLQSLACEDEEGRLVGCLGVMPRPMRLFGAPFRAVATHNFMVDSRSRGGLAAIKLFQAVHRLGPEAQFSEANEQGRRICGALGARVVRARSTRWLRVLKPCALAASVATARLPRSVARPVRSIGDACDRAWARVRRASGRSTEAPRGRTDTLDVALLAELLDRHTSDAALRPVYTEASLAWLLATLRATRRNQYLRARAVYDGTEPVGWFIYYSRPGAVGRVIQLGSSPPARRLVLGHLFDDAMHDGNAAVSGASDPAWDPELAARDCDFRERDTWVTVFSRVPELPAVLESPTAFFGRLEGEGWLRFAF